MGGASSGFGAGPRAAVCQEGGGDCFANSGSAAAAWGFATTVGLGAGGALRGGAALGSGLATTAAVLKTHLSPECEAVPEAAAPSCDIPPAIRG